MSILEINPETNSLFSEKELLSFSQGTNYKLYDKMGAHKVSIDGKTGFYFTLWAPEASKVSLIGDFNNWDNSATPMERLRESGLWTAFLPDIDNFTKYKFHIESNIDDYRVDKSDPYGKIFEQSPGNASLTFDSTFKWSDDQWLSSKKVSNRAENPISIYEVHMGSWMRNHDGGFLSYRDIADKLSDYVSRMGFSHILLLPVAEHPFYGSLGYQPTGLMAPTSRYGTPDDFKYFVDKLHNKGIGVILEWMPTMFPNDEHGLVRFDGSPLYEFNESSQSYCSNCESYFFDYSKNSVKAFLYNVAMKWLKDYHIDGFKINIFSSCCSRFNQDLNDSNQITYDFIKNLNKTILENHPDTLLCASTDYDWENLTTPISDNGAGFSLKFDIQWNKNTLDYFSSTYEKRKFSHNLVASRQKYTFLEKSIMPLSHDEITYGKGSMLNKMPGDNWQKFANLRLLYLYLFTQPGKKLIFMGNEMGQLNEWNHESALDWGLLSNLNHQGLHRLVMELNYMYKNEPSLNEDDFTEEGLKWIECNDWENRTLIYRRISHKKGENLVIALNFTPEPRYGYRIGLPEDGIWEEILNTDDLEYSGSGVVNSQRIEADKIKYQNHDYSVDITLPPLGGILLKK